MNARTVRVVNHRYPYLCIGVVRPTAFALVFLLLAAVAPPASAQQVDSAPVVTGTPAVEQSPAPVVEEPAPLESLPSEVAATPPADKAKVDEETPLEEKSVDGSKESPTPQTAFSSSSFDQITSDLANQKDIAKSNIKNDQATGALQYVYPFELPKGRNGLTPDLGLKYNSQDLKNGIVGFAWQLSIPYIERLNKNGADTMYSDNIFSSSEQGELSLVSGSIYRPRVTETDFTKYDLQSNAWVVTTKDGTKYFYGTAASSRVDNPSDTSKVYRWMLDEIRDTNGNSIFYTYTKNSNQIYPDTISYTKNGSETAPYQVAFSYVTNTTTSSYGSGFLVETTKRLSEVAVSFNSSWVKKYTLSYTQDSLNQRSRLTSISLQGKDEGGATITYPSTTFEYQQSLPSGQNALVSDTVTDRFPVTTYGAVFADVNGDGLVDMVKSSCTNCAYPSIVIDQKVYLNDGTKMVYSSAWSLPSGVYFYADNIDQGYRFADVNGDFKADIVYKTNLSSTAAVYLNNGSSGWTLNSSWTLPHLLFSMNPPATTGQHFIDYTADGYIDSLIFYWVSGNSTPVGWKAQNNSDGTWTDVPYYPGYPNDFIPIVTNPGVYTSDINGDGLADLIQSYNGSSGSVKKIALNTGAGNGFAESTAIDMSSIGYFDPGAYSSAADIWFFGDVNNDGLDDAFLPHNGTTSSTKILGLDTFTGTSGTTWQMTPHPYVGSGGTQFVDINGDGSLDSVTASASANSSQINQAKNPELLTKINYPEGGNTAIAYTRTNQPVSGVLKNPLLATPLNVVSSITTSDGSSTAASASYAYEGGEIWNQSSPHDRKFAGFATVTETTPTTVTKTYYHQGNSSDSSHGEYSDEMWKIGKPYRVEQYDTSSHLYTKTINKWDSYALGSSNAKFVKLTQSVDSTYDGDSSHKDTAVTYTYDNATGNVTQKVEYGQVTGGDDGTFTDTGTDDFTTSVSFTNNTTDNIFLPYTVTVTDHGSGKVKEDRYYYDTQSLGTVTKGNETKHEQWKTGTTYINSQKTYNSTYGTVATSTNPRGKVTSYTYDSYNLYPATVTDPLSHATSYTYDYSSGKVKQTTDVNSLVFQTVYDAMDRPIEEKQPDQTTPSTLVTKTTYAYTDTSGSVSVHKVDYLDGSATVDSYTYFDGLHRPIQTRQEMEDTNTFAVADTIYNSTGQVDKQSLPYSSTGASKTSPTTTTALLVVYSYDPLSRVTSVVDAAGTTSTAYSDWKVTTTDPRGKTKDVCKDAYGNLVQVDEHNSSSTYSTYYEYNGNSNLTKITDALGNVRNFTYDGLGRRLTAQDLHASSDTTYGSWSYTYDDAGNLTQTVDPKAQTVNYTYDDINRKLTEDYTGHTGTETAYTYDSCTRGVGKLCESEVVGTTLSDYQYSPTGQLSQEYENTNSVGMTTTYTYDRQGNKVEVTNPDSSKVKYTYNTAGQLETIQRKESTDGSFINVVTDFDYGPHGKVTYQANQNGTATTNTYDATKLYRLSTKVTTSGSTNLQNLAYTYDANSNITQLVDASDTNSAKTVNYTYDDLNRLLSATTSSPASGQTNYTHTFTYDAIGNILTGPAGSYAYTGNTGGSLANPHATTTVGSTGYDYDENGNVVGKSYSTAPGWYATGGTWTTQKQITIDHTKVAGTADVTNFPVLVKIQDASLKSSVNGGSVAKSDGTDILFTAADGVTKLSHEIEKYVAYSGELVAWVKVPVLKAAQDTNIIMYYGNSSASDQQDKAGTWESAYKGVWHLNGQLGDSTSNANTATDVSSVDTDGKIGPGRYFDGSGDRLTVANSASLKPTTGITLSAWIQRGWQTQGANAKAVWFGDNSASPWGQYGFQFESPSTRIVNFHLGSSSAGYDSYSTTNINNNTWYYVVGTFDGTNRKIYVNGTLDATDSATFTLGGYDTTNGLGMGDKYQSGTAYVGDMDEVRVSSTAKSADWIQTEYNNQNSPSTFLSFGSVSGGSVYDSYNYNYKNQLYQTNTGAYFGYDADGQRVRATLSGTTTLYPTPYYNSDGTTMQKHILTPDGQTIATVKGTGTTAAIYYTHTDHLTGSNAITNSAGTLEELLDYYPYGATRLDEQTGAFSEKHQFTNYIYDVTTGLNYAGQRYYDSNVGRYTSQDPYFFSLQFDLSDPQSLNAYAYARNNPLRYVDPDGKWFSDVITGKQSWSSFAVEAGDAANYLYSNGGAWQVAMNNPYAPAVVGATPLAVYGAISAAPTAAAWLLSNPQLVTNTGIGAVSGVTAKAISNAETGQSSGALTYGLNAMGGGLSYSAGDSANAVRNTSILSASVSILSDLSDGRSVSWRSAIWNGVVSGGATAIASQVPNVRGREVQSYSSAATSARTQQQVKLESFSFSVGVFAETIQNTSNTVSSGLKSAWNWVRGK